MRLVSWDSNAINDGTSYSSSLEVGAHTPAGVTPGIVAREGGPLVGGAMTTERYFVIRTTIPSTGDKRALQAQWYQWFRPEKKEIKSLVIEDDDGSNERYMQAMPIDITHEPDGDGWILLTTLVGHDDPAWRSVAEDSETWNITASGQTKSATNGGAARNLDAYPVYTITPNANKSSNQIRGKFVTVRWRSDRSATDYPVDIVNGSLDTAALVGAGKMQADGDDLRVVVDGVEVDYWLSGINTTTTKVWCVLNFQPKQEFTLSSSRSSGSTSDIVVGEDISAMPSVGLLEIDSEIFSYTSKDNASRAFRGITAGAKNSSAAGHSAGSTVRWIQHDIQITYGDASASAYASNAARKPIFLLTSTNTSWVYQDFYEDGESRPGAWAFASSTYTDKYGGNQHSTADPFGELGVASTCVGAKSYSGGWTLYSPCGISAANFTNGEKYHAGSVTNWTASIRSSPDGNSFTTQYSIPKPTVVTTWQSWSQNVTGLTSGTRYIALWLQGEGTLYRIRKIECADVTVTLDSSMTPTTAVGSEANSYQLRATLENTTTGEALEINFDMALGSSLEIDTDTLAVTYLTDGSGQYQAITPDGLRDTLLRLGAGANTLEWTDPGTTDVVVGISWRPRWVN